MWTAVVRVHGFLRTDLAAKDQVRAIRDDLVGVHVRRRTGAGLEDVEYEVSVELTVHHLLRSLPDSSGALRIQQAELLVHLGRSTLDRAQGV
jgi:thiazole synthase ThiGH ThiG subunit